MTRQVFLKPRLSEKTYALAGEKRVYVFDVPLSENKHTVKAGVEAQFETEVINVRIVNIRGKAKRTVSRGGKRVVNGVNSDRKKAYVTLAEGKSLPFFAAIEEAETKQDKIDSQIEKKAAKDLKKAEKVEAKQAKKGTK